MLSTKHKLARIGEIIQLVSEQEPERTDIVQALKKCSYGKWTSSGYYRFYLPAKKSKGPAMKFKENIMVEHNRLGLIVLDVYTNGSIAGIEFINLIEE
jgi:hypothetical protein